MPPKGYSIYRVDWWCDKATELARESGFTHRYLAESIVRVFGYKVEATQITRCLSGQVLNLELAGYLSEILGLPRPVIIPASLDIAYALASAQTMLNGLSPAKTSGSGET